MRRTLVVAAVLLVVIQSLGAQTIRGQMSDSVSRSTLPGAFLTLVDEQGVEHARAMTNGNGVYVLTAPSPGVYRLRSKRIGFRPYLSPALTLRDGEAVSYDVIVDPIPIALREIVVAGERQCDVDAGASVKALWDEVREALAAVSWTSHAPGYWYEIIQYQRELTAGANPAGDDSTWHEVGYQRVPFKSAPAEQLARLGYVVVAEDGWTYFAPDADVLLSDPFLHTHCFETKVGQGETSGLVGLGFTPARGRKLSDVSGTLWVDAKTAELHHLEFSYTRLPERVMEPRAGGRVSFVRMAAGVWIVSEWMIRMPIAERRRRSVAEGGGEGLPTVVGFRERGGNAAEIKTNTGAVVYRAAPADTAAAAVAAVPAPPSAPSITRVTKVTPVTGPAPHTRPVRSGSRDMLTAEEFTGTSANNAYTLVQRYRPNWLRGRGPRSLNDTTARLQVYLNNSFYGDLDRLKELPAEDILEMRMLQGGDATTKYGVNHSGGVIEVVTH